MSQTQYFPKDGIMSAQSISRFWDNFISKSTRYDANSLGYAGMFGMLNSISRFTPDSDCLNTMHVLSTLTSKTKAETPPTQAIKISF